MAEREVSRMTKATANGDSGLRSNRESPRGGIRLESCSDQVKPTHLQLQLQLPSSGRPDDPQLADQLSSSLASLATLKGPNRTPQAGAEAAGSENSTSDTSSTFENAAGASASNAAVITASTATTNSSGSGEDRDSSTGNGSGGQENFNVKNNDEKSIVRHHSYRQRRQRQGQNETAEGKSNDDYGLPVPVDDRLERQSGSGHAVVARLPPPTTDSGSSGEGEQDRTQDSGSLLQPHREPAFHTIRRTFKKLPARSARATNKSSETESSGDQAKTRKKGVKRSAGPTTKTKDSNKSRRPPVDSVNLDTNTRGGDGDPGGSGSSSGSGTEGGYAGSASSNENGPKDGSAGSSSSEIPDFSSGASENGAVGAGGYAFNTSPSNSPSLSSSSTGDGEGSSDDQDDGFVPSESTKPLAIATGNRVDPTTRRNRRHAEESYADAADRKASAHTHNGWPPVPHRVSRGGPQSQDQHADQRRQETTTNGRHTHAAQAQQKETTKLKSRRMGLTEEGKPPILMAGCDVMAHVLTFLEPPDILSVLTMPLSKDWLNTFCRNQELWRVLCLLEPFKAQVDSDGSDESSDCSISSFSTNTVPNKPQFGKYRLLYTSFVRCMRYLAQVKDDAIHGRHPSVIEIREGSAGGTSSSSMHDITQNRSLKHFLASARGIVGRRRPDEEGSSDSSENESRIAVSNISQDKAVAVAQTRQNSRSTSVQRGRKRKKSSDRKSKKKRKQCKQQFGRSVVTDRLLRPGRGGEVDSTNLELPWSCAIFSIVNWMVAFSDVEGIQIMCLKVLPFLLEDERQRITAQRAGLTDVILRGMVIFPNSVQLHTVSFHTIVLLARPLGGREGMLFHSSMVNSSGIFGTSGLSARSPSSAMFTGGSQNGNSKNGIAVMLDSMRRFADEEVLQAMSCWSLVNIALAPIQKEVLVKLGGIEVIANAMMQHPHSAEVQFRALFALINLVIPSVNLGEATQSTAAEQQEQLAAAEVNVNGSSEEEVWDEIVGQVVDLVVLAMKNFCSSEAIMNRACLVLHNLSLTPAYHTTLLWTPNCYQMLEWCLANYRTDEVLQQSAAGTLHRLQVTLSNDENLSARFAALLQAQQRQSLEDAHREAIHIHEQQRILQERGPQAAQELNGRNADVVRNGET